MSNLTANFKIWIESDERRGILGDGKCKLLKTIDETGSLKAAVILLGLTYRNTWNSLKKTEEILGFRIIYRQRGGKNGGNTILTPQGKAIVLAFEHFHAKCDSIIAQALADAVGEIQQQLS